MDHQALAQLLGSYGEFIGAIAVVLTLIYLANQINQNTKAMKSNAYREVSRTFADHSWDVAQNYELASIVLGTLSGETHDDDPVRKHQADMVLRTYFMRMELLYNEVEFGVGPPERWAVFRDYTRAFLEQPAVRASWEVDKHIYGEGFVRSIEEAVPGDMGLSPLQDE